MLNGQLNSLIPFSLGSRRGSDEHPSAMALSLLCQVRPRILSAILLECTRRPPRRLPRCASLSKRRWSCSAPSWRTLGSHGRILRADCTLLTSHCPLVPLTLEFLAVLRFSHLRSATADGSTTPPTPGIPLASLILAPLAVQTPCPLFSLAGLLPLFLASPIPSLRLASVAQLSLTLPPRLAFRTPNLMHYCDHAVLPFQSADHVVIFCSSSDWLIFLTARAS